MPIVPECALPSSSLGVIVCSALGNRATSRWLPLSRLFITVVVV